MSKKLPPTRAHRGARTGLAHETASGIRVLLLKHYSEAEALAIATARYDLEDKMKDDEVQVVSHLWYLLIVQLNASLDQRNLD